MYSRVQSSTLMCKVRDAVCSQRGPSALRSGSLVSPTPPCPYLEGVAAWRHIGDVNPLAVDVMAVGVPAPHTHPLLTKVGTGKASLKTCRKERR